MPPLRQIRICGLGGQGVVLAGTILGHAAVRDGQYASGSNAYGAQARGGTAQSEVVISSEPIGYPHVIRADVLIVLSQTAYDTWAPDTASQGWIFYDPAMVAPDNDPPCRQVQIPATDAATRELGNKQVANMVMLCAAACCTGMVSRKALEGAIGENSPGRFLDPNLKAMDLGFRLGETAKWR